MKRKSNVELLTRVVMGLAVFAVVGIFGVFLLPDTSLSTQADIGSLVATTFALVMAVFAIVLAISVERSEYKAKEKLREDVVSLLAVLHASLSKLFYFDQCLSYTEGGTRASPSLEREIARIEEILHSSTGFALASWCNQKSMQNVSDPEKYRTTFLRLSNVIESLRIVDFGDFPGDAIDAQNAVRQAAFEVRGVLDLLGDLKAADVIHVAKTLDELDSAVTNYEDVRRGDPADKYFSDIYAKGQKAQIDALGGLPTDNELDYLVNHLPETVRISDTSMLKEKFVANIIGKARPPQPNLEIALKILIPLLYEYGIRKEAA